MYSSVVTFSNSRTHHVRLELTCCVDSRTNRTSSVDFAFHLVYSADTTVISDVVSVRALCSCCVVVSVYGVASRKRVLEYQCPGIVFENSTRVLSRTTEREYQSNVVGDFSRTPFSRTPEREREIRTNTTTYKVKFSTLLQLPGENDALVGEQVSQIAKSLHSRFLA